MRDLLDQTSSDEDEGDALDHSSPDSQGQTSTNHTSPLPTDGSGAGRGRITHQEFLFGYASSMTTLRILHPPGAQIPAYWAAYIDSIDPMVRILHKPTAARLVAQAARDAGSLGKSDEALLFAMYMAVVMALTPEECQARLGLEREVGMRRYRYATEQALARAGFLASQELVVLQAFLLYLVCVKRQGDSKCVWSLSGLLLRMAHSMGLHRDGTKFGLTAFDTEMRRRIWWQVCVLDVRASEDQGTEPMVVERFFDTQFPLNVNDADIWPDMQEPPREHEGATEMTFDLVRYEVGKTMRVLTGLQKCPKAQTEHGLRLQEEMLEKLKKTLEEKYLRHCDLNHPLQWVCVNISKLVSPPF